MDEFKFFDKEKEKYVDLKKFYTVMNKIASGLKEPEVRCLVKHLDPEKT
jgi:hypothetical protein